MAYPRQKGAKLWVKVIKVNRQQIINAVECPSCRAVAGSPCKRGSRKRKTVHPSRVSAATFGVVRCGSIKVRKSQLIKPDFYQSWEWKEARFKALKIHGRRCLCCGWSPVSGGENHLVVDHIKPIRTHPHLALDPNNHQVLCNDCNMGKSYKHTDDFR